MKILFLDKVHPVLESKLMEIGFECLHDTSSSGNILKRKISEADCLVVRSRIALTKEYLTDAKQLKCIARAGSGMENIDTVFALTQGIICLNAPEGNCDAVGEHAVALLLSLLRKVVLSDREVRNGEWLREKNKGIELGSLVVGIIGYGNTGKAFARKLSGFGCRVMAYDKYLVDFTDEFAEASSLSELTNHADVVSLHVPLTDETFHLAGSDFFNRFRKNIYFLNTSRGGCVSTDGLVEGLKSGKVIGAGLDVIEYEDSSLTISLEKISLNESWNYLVHTENVVLTPHIAGVTHQSSQRIAEVLAEKIIKLLS